MYLRGPKPAPPPKNFLCRFTLISGMVLGVGKKFEIDNYLKIFIPDNTDIDVWELFLYLRCQRPARNRQCANIPAAILPPQDVHCEPIEPNQPHYTWRRCLM